MAKAHSKKGAAMVMVIITTVLFTMMSFSLILSSSTLSSSANRKWTQLRMEQQALGVGRAFTQALTEGTDTSLQIALNTFLSSNYNSYDFSQTNSFVGYGQVIIRLKKVPQLLAEVEQLKLNTNISISVNRTALDDFLKSLSYADYRITVYITVVSPDDAQAIGTAEVTFFRITTYGALYYKDTSRSTQIYPADADWKFFLEPNFKTRVTDLNAEIIAVIPSVPVIYYYLEAELR